MVKRILSLTICVVLLFSMLPFTTYAAEATENGNITSFTKTANWTDAPIKDNAEIELTTTINREGKVPKILFLGSLCDAHSLSTETMKNTMQACLNYADVDYYFYSTDSNLKTYIKSGSSWKNSGDYKSSTYNGSLNKGDKFDVTFDTKSAFNHPRHACLYNVAYRIQQTDFSKYDMLVLETDAARMGLYTATPTSDMTSSLLAAAKKMKQLYADNKVVWVIPQKNFEITDSDIVKSYEAKYIFNEFYLTHALTDQGKTSSGSNNGNFYSEQTYQSMAILDPEDWLTADGKSKKTPPVLAPKDASKNQYNDKIFEAFLPNIPIRCAGSEDNPDPYEQIWVTYEQSKKVEDFIVAKIESLINDKLEISDIVKDGFTIKENGVKGYRYDESKGEYVQITDNNFSYVIDSKNTQKVTGTFHPRALAAHNVKMTIEVSVNSDETDPFKTKAITDTNEGDATVEYYLAKPGTVPVEYEKIDDDAVSTPSLEKKHYLVTTEVVNGTIDPSTTVYESRDVKINYSPDEHYHIKSITVDDKELSSEEIKENLDNYEFKNVNEDHNIKVVYEIDKCNVVFDTQGGTTEEPIPVQTIDYGEKAENPDVTPEKEGYIFTNWYKEPECINEWIFDEDIVIGDTIIYAGYEDVITTLHYDANGGEDAPDNQEMKTSEAEYIADEDNIPTRDGYTFEGWADTKEKADNHTVDYMPGQLYKDENVLKPDATLYAAWKEDYVTLNYDATIGGTVSSSEETIKIFTGEAEGSTAVPDTGYHFVNWTDSSGNEVSTDLEFIPERPDTGYVPETYTAHFAIDQLNVSYDMHGHGVGPDSHNVDYGSFELKPTPDPSEDGYIFDGWYTDETYAEEFDFTNPIIEDTVIHAKWLEKTAPLHYDANGGEDAPEDQVMKYSEQTDLSENIPTRKGYTFKGWAVSKEDADKGTVKYSPEDKYKDAEVEPVEATLYAVWEENLIDIFYIADEGGSVTNDKDTVKEYVEIPEGSAAIPDNGYHFTNWTNSNGDEVSKNAVFVPEKDKDGKNVTDTYTAHFAINEYTVKFDTQGHDENPDNQTKKYNEKADKPTDPQDEGFKFEGWYKEPACENPWDFDNDTVTEDVTLYGKWSEVAVPLHYDANGGTYAPDDQMMTYSERTDTSNEKAVWAGHIFRGWAESKKDADDHIVKYTPNQLYKNQNVVPVEATLYAVWDEMESVTINYQALEGGEVSNDKDVVNPETGKPEGSVATESTGYTFSRWVDEGGKTVSEDKSFTPSKDKETGLYEAATYTAIFIPIDYTVTFDIHGHGDQPEKQIHHINDKVDDPGKLTEEGYTFEGWYKETDYKEPWGFDTDKVEGDTTIHAKWSENNAPLHYDANGGENAPADQIMFYSTQTDLVKDIPSRDGFIFKGWAVSKEEADKGNVKYNPEDKYKDAKVEPKEATLYAVWEEETIDIFYKADKGGKVSKGEDTEVKVFEGKEDLGSLATPDTGYHFVNWTNSKGEEVSKECNFVPSPDKDTKKYFTDTYTAHFEINEYTVKFDTQGHDENPDDQTKKYNEKVDKPTPDPSDEGFVFDGWYKEPECKTPWDFDEDTVTEDITLYGKWHDEDVPLHYDANGGTYAPKDQIMTYSKETDVSEEKAIWAGHDFKGWATSKENADKGIVSYLPEALYKNEKVVPVEATLYAVWNESKIEIHYTALEGGSVDNDSDIVDAVTGKPEGSTATPDKGYEFTKWTDEKGDTVSTDSEFVPSKDKETDLFVPQTYTAVFTPIDYTVKFDIHGHGEQPKDQIHNYNDLVDDPGKLTEEGYTFEGWYKESDYKEPWKFDTDKVEGDTTIHAKWEEITATLKYDPNGGINPPEDQILRYSEDAYVSDGQPTRENYIFKGWSIEKDGEIVYTGSELYKDKNVIPKDGILYAVWEEVTVPLHYKADKGGTVTNDLDIVKKYSGQPDGSTAEHDEGYHFAYWYDDSKEKVSFSNIFVPEKPEGGFVEATYTAVFEINKYDVVFEMNNHGEQVPDQIVDYGNKAEKPDDPTEPGFKFENWYKDPECTEVFDFNTEIKEDTIVYAKWTEENVPLHYDANGGTYAPEDQIMTYSKRTDVSDEKAMWAGHVFKGWAESKKDADDHNVKYTPNQLYKNQNIVPVEATLYAVWDDMENVTINYQALEGGEVSNDKDVVNPETGKPDGSVATESEGYTFLKWVDEDGNTVSEEKSFIPSKDKETGKFEAATYTAVFEPVNHTVKFDTDGKGETPEDQTVIHNGKVVKPDDPKCDGFVLYSWYKDKEHKEEWNFDKDIVVSDTTLYAYWTKIISDPDNPLKPAPGIVVNPPKDRYYSGKEIKATDVVITNDGKELVLGKDYKIIGYEKNIEVGKAYVIVEGLGPAFTGKLKVPFNILPVSATNNEAPVVQNTSVVQTGSVVSSIVLLVLSVSCAVILMYVSKRKKKTRE